MSAELLREAATKMRERAQAAVPGPWESSANSDDQCFVYGINLEGEVSAEIFVHDGTRRTELDTSAATAEHMASWHPAVALAVADWLELTADQLPRLGPAYRLSEQVAQAVTVARAYLGRPE